MGGDNLLSQNKGKKISYNLSKKSLYPK